MTIESGLVDSIVEVSEQRRKGRPELSQINHPLPVTTRVRSLADVMACSGGVGIIIITDDDNEPRKGSRMACCSSGEARSGHDRRLIVGVLGPGARYGKTNDHGLAARRQS